MDLDGLAMTVDLDGLKMGQRVERRFPKKTSTVLPKTSTIPPVKRVLKIDEWFHPDGFPISIERREPQEDFEPHAHEFAELVIVMGGKGLHVTGSDSWELTAGDVFVIAGPTRT